MRQWNYKRGKEGRGNKEYLYLFFINFVGFVVDYHSECEEI